MTSFSRLPLVALFALITGCSSTAVLDSPAGSKVETAPGPELPVVELSPDLLYQLLLAEFSGQQGALQLSAKTYLDAAQRTRDYRLARRATRIAVYARKSGLALEAAQLWVELDPNNYDAHKSVAALLIASGLTSKARPHLDVLLAPPHQDSNQGYQLVATLLASDPNAKRALRTMAELVAQQPESSHALFAQAHLANQLGDNQVALTVLQQLLAHHPDHSQGVILQAKVLHRLDDVDGAIQSMERALAIAPDNHKLRLTYARMLIDARKLKQARKQFTFLSKAMPNDADVVYALGLLAMEAHDLKEAESHFNKLLTLQQREEESRFAQGQIAEAKGEYEKAIEWFSSIASGERYLEAQLQAARLITEHRSLAQGRTYLRELETQNDDERIQLYLAEAELLIDQQLFNEAMEVYAEGLQTYVDNTDLLYARALTGEKMGRLDILERDLKQILKQHPNDSRTLNALGYTLADRTDRYQEAYDYIERAYKQKPDDVAFIDSMGWVLYRLGRLDEAEEYLQRAAAILRDAEIAAHFGEVLWVNGKPEQARKVWQEALEYAPEHDILQRTIKRFLP